MSRWWAVALLSLSVGLNLGLAVAVVQQRLAPAPQPAPPTVVVMPSPAVAAPAESAGSSSPPMPVHEVAPAPVAVASPLGAAPPQQQQQAQQRPRPPQTPPEEPLVPLEEAFDLGPEHDGRGPGPGGMGGGPGGGGGPSPARLEQLAQRLGVPAGDRPRFVELQQRFLVEARTHRIQLETVRQGLRGELTAPQPDTERLRALVDASARLQGALERAFVEHVLAARELLDGEAEQRYLKFLARLGPRAVAGGGPPPGQGQMRPLDPRWQQRDRWGGRGGGLGGRRPPPPGRQGAPFGQPAPAPSPN